jgi:tetratricopeptide (TPR) repeat protein
MDYQVDEYLVCSGAPQKPAAARQVLSEMDVQLITARAANVSEAEIAVECYLPMFDAAILLNHFPKAQEIRREIDESTIPEGRLPEWWSLNFRLDHALHDYEAAEGWCRKGLEALTDKDRNTPVAFHQLGLMAQHEGDYDAAEQWFQRSLEIVADDDDAEKSAAVCHQLGRAAQDNLELAQAEKWFDEALSIKEQTDDKSSAARTCHQLGMIAKVRRDFRVAEKWYQRAIDLSKEDEHESQAACSYFQLGQVAMADGEVDTAEKWYNEALAADGCDGTGVLGSCVFGELGAIAVENEDYDAARRLFVRALELADAHGSDVESADVFAKIAGLAGLEERYEECGRWYMKSVLGFLKSNDAIGARTSAQDLIVWYQRAPRPAQEQLREMWKSVGLGPFLDDEFDDGFDDLEIEEGVRSIDVVSGL